MRKDHMVGLCLHHDDPDWGKVRGLGTKWVRHGIPYPWEDRVNGTYSDAFLKAIGYLKVLKRQGINVLVSTPAMGSTRYDKAVGDTVWHPGYPAWMGSMDEDFYYEALAAGIKEIVRVVGDDAEYYQLGNEPDFGVFIGPVTREQNIRFNKTSILALKEAGPDKKGGINLAGVAGEHITEYALWLTKTLYRDEALPYDWLGLDGYFGCWQPGGPENWKPYMDTMAELSGKPLIISEWGYGTNYEAPFEKDFKRIEYYNNVNCKNKRWENMWKGQKHTPELQAEFIRECLQIFADHPACIGNFFFRYSDAELCWQCGEHDCPTETHWGVVGVNEEIKPGYAALRDVSAELFGA